MTGIRQSALGAVLDAAPDAMLAVDRNGFIVAVNRPCEKLFGYGHGVLLGRPIEAFVPEAQRNSHVLSRTDYSGNPRPRAMNLGLEVRGIRFDGSEIPLQVTLTPVETAEGTLTLAAIRDRSEQHARTRGLVEAGRMETRFLAGISHQFRTPLNAIVGFAELAYQSQFGPISPQQRELLGNVLRSSEQLLRLLDDVLEIANIDLGRAKPESKPLSAADILDDACECQRMAVAQKNIAIRIEFEPVPGIVSDRRRLRQVFNLLLSHAVAVNPAGHGILLSVRPDGEERFRIEVHYRERPLEPDELEHLFVEFHRPTPGSEQDAHLSLPLARRCVELLRGRIGAASDPDGDTVLSAVLPRRVSVG